MRKRYKHIFFDLDRTLWDFDASSNEAFHDIYTTFELKNKGVNSVSSFKDYYNHHNEILWNQYREGRLSKEVLRGLRFRLTLKEFGVDNEELAQQIGIHYVKISPLLVHLFPNAFQILDYLHSRYQLHIITNGFSEVQFTKIKVSGLDKYFKEVITSEEAGVKKPDPQIFEFAFNKAETNADVSLMIGDDFNVDIIGAKTIGMDQVLFDPDKESTQNGVTYYINDLIELKKFL